MSDRSPIVYPIGILVMGQEMKILEPRSTLARVLGQEEEGPPRHKIVPFVYNLVRFAPAASVVRFVVRRNSTLRVDSVHAFGPGLIEQVMIATDILYEKQPNNEDGKLFFCPHRLVEEGWDLALSVRCLPELFMLEGGDVEEINADLPDTKRATIAHDSSQCPDCIDFAKRTGLES